MRFPIAVLLFSCAVMLASPLLAQSPNGVLNGQVLDPSAGVIVGAEIVAVNDVTGVQYTTKTNSEGIYVLANLPPGPYRLQVSKLGFKTLIKPDITLNVQDALSINFTLPVGALAETVTVEGGAPLVNSESATVSTVIDRKFVENLPLNGRSFNTLLQLTPGVVISPTSSISPGQYSIGGQRTSANNFVVDGVSANFGVGPNTVPGASGTGTAQAFSAIGGTSSLVSVEALQEFRVLTSSFAPEFGHTPGGQVILETRSGTNELHGGVYEYFRNDVLDANDWFANAAGQPRPPERHNDFGAFLGGPLQRTKTFFFLSYEGARLRLPQVTPYTVPSSGIRTSPSTPADLVPLLNAYPLPNGVVSADGYTAQLTGVYSNSATLDAGSIRVDHAFSGKYSLFGRYNQAPSQLVSFGQGLNDPQTTSVDTRTLTFGINMLCSDQVSNIIRANYFTQHSGGSYQLTSAGGAVPYPPSLLAGSLPSVDTYVLFGTFDTNFLISGPLAKNTNTQLNVNDDLSVSVGSHRLKFGGDYRANYLNARPYQNLLEYLGFNLQGLLSTSNADFMIPITTQPSRLVARSLSLYGQDAWKISPRLTLTYGIRWELSPAPSARGNTVLAAWKNVDNPPQITLAPPGTSVWQTTYANFAPRLGVAYALTEDGSFVFRAGAGIFYDLGVGSSASLTSGFPNLVSGFFGNVHIPVNDVTPFLPIISLDPPYQGTVNAFSPDLKLPRSFQWNTALEKSFRGRQVVSATYLGQAGRKLLRSEGLGQPTPDFQGTFYLTGNTARSDYHALQLQYRRPVGQSVQALFNYSWSHSIDNASNDTIQYVSHSIVSALNDRASSDFDIRHSLSGAITLAIPGSNKFRSLNSVIKDWSVYSVIVVRSGFPFNGVVQSAVQGAVPRANLVPDQPVWLHRSGAPGGKSLNPAAFSIPPAGTQGSEPRNDISGFGLTQLDFSLARKFLITQRLNLQFRADAFNALNHPNFTNPVATIGSGVQHLSSESMLNHGLGGLNPLFQEGGPRSLQLSLRLAF